MDNPITGLKKSERICTNSGWDTLQTVLDAISTSPIPFVGLPSVAVQSIQKNLRIIFNNKFEVIQNEIILGKKFITTNQLNEIQVFENFTRLLQTANKTNVNEKIQLAARLFIRGCLTDTPLTTGVYEEYLHIIDDISIRELYILKILRAIELNPDSYIDNSKSEKGYMPDRYWKAFKEKVSTDLAIAPDHIYPIMKRIERTGLFAMWNGFTFGAVESGLTTDYFCDFYRFIIDFSPDA